MGSTSSTTMTNIRDHADFYRLANGLRAMKKDFNYTKTRKLLDPKWDGYITDNADIEADDVELNDANLLTSRHRCSELHRIVLDLDYGATLTHRSGRRHLILKMNRPDLARPRLVPSSFAALLHHGVIVQWAVPQEQVAARGAQWGINNNRLELITYRDLALIPSSTPGHYHLILDVNLSWSTYTELLKPLAVYGIIEPGYANASIKNGYTAIRPPWVKK